MHSSDAHGHGFLKKYAYEYVVPHLYYVYEYANVYGCVREYAPTHHDYAHGYGYAHAHECAVTQWCLLP